MKTHYLLNALKDSVKEKRMLFGVEDGDKSFTPADRATEPVQPPEGVTPSAPASPDAPQPPAPEAPKTSDQLKKNIESKMENLKPQLETIINAPEGTYTKKLVETAKAFQAKLAEIDKTLKTVDPAKLDTNKDEDKQKITALENFDKQLTDIAPQYGNEKLKTNQDAATLIKLKREKLAKIKAEITADKVFDDVLINIGGADEIPAKIVEALKAKFDTAKFQSETIDVETLRLGTFLEEADNETDIAKIDTKIAEFAKDEDLTPESFNNEDFVKAHKPILAEVARLESLGGDGKACKAAKEAMAKGVAELINSKDETAMKPEVIKSEYEQSILIGHVCDVLNSKKAEGTPEITPESIQKALRYYELGKHESGKEGAEAKKILDLLVANKDLLTKAGIKMDLMGGTDGTDHRLLTAKAYHEAKAAALKKLLAFGDSGKLNVTAGGIDLTAGSATRKLIEEYIAETAKGKGYEFAKDHQAEFCTGGKIFDAALAVQRAEDMKKRLSDNKDDAFGIDEEKDANGGVAYKLKKGESGLAIELGSTKEKEEERKSGLNFSAIEKKPEAKGDKDETPPDDTTEDPEDEKDEDDDETFKGKYSTPEFRAEIKKEIPGAKNENIEAKTQEVYGEGKHGDKLEDALKNPEFKKEVAKRLETPPAPTDADPAHPDDSKEEAAERAKCKEAKTPYMTYNEALKAGVIREVDNPYDPGTKITVVTDESTEFVDDSSSSKNYAVKPKTTDTPDPVAPDAAPETSGGDVKEFEVPAGSKVEQARINEMKAFVASGISVVDFSGTNCGPCRAMKQAFHDLARTGLQSGSEKVKFANLNYEDYYESEIAQRDLKVESFPTVIVFKNGAEKGRFVGGRDRAALESEIKRLIA